ncbi:Holliday junction branch migration protein RuvA [Microbacterium paludicola]|uniref:Holliday junction branch migration complex subunit RuvA n=1 Tax=Microbacterium paludicola TaxID=300019 RepID=A0A4Y9FQF7_9MICO|nr:Holliday junction branch migration protein RuvA [Microbacterium paludicola]MBF0817369.1 Holliday junction branch migration protein RuvA [Microbacterium paludicola]TFU31465.1 Holliday junction branch migration protein RuvA [Microbacterium paludicola]
MISSLRGTVLHAGTDSVIVEVGGVGFSVAVPPDVARTARVGESLFLHTTLIVREDALSLFGFATRDELDVFGTMLTVSGVGPKSALGVLSALTVDQIAAAVAEDDDKPFRRVSGIGPKTAKLIVVQLQGKLAPPVPSAAPSAAATDVTDRVVQAVAGLGWPERVASDAVAQAAEGASDADRASVQALLRLTLALLGPAQHAGAARG